MFSSNEGCFITRGTSSGRRSGKVFRTESIADEAFCYFYKQVVEESKNFTEPPTLPRIRRPPRRYDSDSDPHCHQTPDDYYRQMYFEVIDVIKSEIARRFDQGSLGLQLDMRVFC